MEKLVEKIKGIIVSNDSEAAAKQIIELLRSDDGARRQLLYGISPYICPYFASCAVPAYGGEREYFFITKVCLTKEYENCVHKGSLDHFKIETIEDNQTICPRLGRCLTKIRRPIEEFIMVVCGTEEHRKCPWYVAWYYRGAHPEDNMESMEAVPEEEI